MEPIREVDETPMVPKDVAPIVTNEVERISLKERQSEEVILLNAGKAKMMENRCPLCFNDAHRFADCRRP